MPIQDSDLFLIESGSSGPIIAGKSFKITASKLKSSLAANEYFNYKLLVNKPDYTSRFVYTQNMQSSVSLTDYMMVERSGVSYKVTGQQIIDYFPSVPAGAAGPITDVQGAGANVYTTDTIANVVERSAWNQTFNWTNLTRSTDASGNTSGSVIAIQGGPYAGGTGSERLLVSPQDGYITIDLPAGVEGGIEVVAESDGVNQLKARSASGAEITLTNSSDKQFVGFTPVWGSTLRLFTGDAGGGPVLYRVYVGGQLLVDPGVSGAPSTGGGSVLTFPTSNNFDKFEVGDVVQGPFSGYPTLQQYCNLDYSDGTKWESGGTRIWPNAFDGRLDTYVSPAIGYTCTLTYPEGVWYVDGDLTAPSAGNAVNSKMFINGVDVTSDYVASRTLFSNGYIRSISFNRTSSSDGIQFANWRLNGVLLNIEDNSAINDIKPDATPPTITVDGGSWLGADTSGTVGGDTELTKTSRYDNKLTLASDTNLDLFTFGDAINMVDDNGDVASYTPVTSTISNAALIPAWNKSGNWSGMVTEEFGSLQGSNSLFDGNITTFAKPNRPCEVTFTPSSPISCSKIKVLIQNPGATGGSNNGCLRINGVGYGNQIPATANETAYVEINATSLTQIKFSIGVQSGPGCSMGAIYVDDLILVNSSNSDPDPGRGTQLSFASPNQDLKFFNPGELIQQIERTITGQALIDNSPVFISNAGSNSTDAANLYSTSTASNYVQLRAYFAGIKFTLPLVVNSKLRIYMGGEQGYNGAFLNGPTSPEDTTAGYGPIAMGSYSTGQQTWIDCTSYIPSFPFLLERIGCKSIDGGGYIRWYGIEVDGVVLMTSQPATVRAQASVISTDTTANTMVVDGGSWAGSDGSSSGDAADRETVVTSYARSGTGNFAGNNGPVVDVSNSNQQWIDNTNRLGENFFIKSASARTGLAVLRTKAIAQAQAWAADSDYVADQFVEHNGRYWLALSSSTNNSPDETDTAQWFDLGAIE